jgi:hypothetical protein
MGVDGKSHYYPARDAFQDEDASCNSGSSD